MMLSSTEIGKLIKQKQKEKRYTQIELANAIGVSNTYVSDIEIGRNNPSIKTLVKILDILNMELQIIDKPLEQ
jgi:transcriptional regulator with XRE-family HTH domain